MKQIILDKTIVHIPTNLIPSAIITKSMSPVKFMKMSKDWFHKPLRRFMDNFFNQEII
jgi:hypothetical protein